MKTSRYIILIFSTLLSTFGTRAQSSVQTKVDTRQITIGDQVRYFIEVKKDRGEQLVWANIPDTFNNLEVVEKGKIDTLNTDGNTIFKQRLLITGFDSGVFQIPAFEFACIAGNDSPHIIYSDSFELFVQTIAVDTTKPFKDIKDIKDAKLTWFDYLFTGLSIWGKLLLLTVLIMVVYTFWKKKNKKPYIPPPSETPHERATRLLIDLDKKELWQRDEVKKYYVELTDILRIYIEGRFGITVMELTTDELLYKMKTHKELTKYRDIIGGALRIADMAKFAKAQPLPEEHIDAFSKISQFVAITEPREEPKQNTKKK